MAPATGSASLATAATKTSQVAVVPFDITTTYTAPTQCAQSAGGLTMLENDQYRVWLNAILPVPGTTVTSCYPNQFISSFLLQTGGVSQAAFSPLVCPSGYTTQGPFTSNYIACCPSGWDGLALSSGAPSDRPAFGGTCYSNIYNVPVSVSFYDNSAFKASSIFTATATDAQAFAYPYEGFALGVAIVKSITGSTATSNSAPSSSSTSAFFSSQMTTAPYSTESPSGTAKPHHALSDGAKAGIAIAGIAIAGILGAALLLLASFLILRHRRKNLGNRNERYNDLPPVTHDPNAPNAGYYNSEPKKDIPHPEELYGSQDVKNHGETQELDSSRTVYEMGGGSDYARSTSSRRRDKRLPSLPSPTNSSVSRTPISPYPGT